MTLKCVTSLTYRIIIIEWGATPLFTNSDIKKNTSRKYWTIQAATTPPVYQAITSCLPFWNCFVRESICLFEFQSTTSNFKFHKFLFNDFLEQWLKVAFLYTCLFCLLMKLSTPTFTKLITHRHTLFFFIFSLFLTCQKFVIFRKIHPFSGCKLSHILYEQPS